MKIKELYAAYCSQMAVNQGGGARLEFWRAGGYLRRPIHFCDPCAPSGHAIVGGEIGLISHLDFCLQYPRLSPPFVNTKLLKF